MSIDPATLLGRTYAADPVRPERWESYIWAEATENPDEQFRRPTASHQYVPPTFGQVLARRAAGTEDIEAKLRDGGRADPSIFLGGTRFRFDEPLRVGESYAATAEFTDLDTKTGTSGNFQVLTLEYEIETQEAHDAIDDERTVEGRLVFRMETDFVVRDESEDGIEGENGDEGRGKESERDGRRRRAKRDDHDADDLAGPTVLARRTVGSVSPAAMRVVTAIVRDPNPLHFDPRYAAESGLPGRVNQGPINASYAAQAALAVADDPAALRVLDARYEGFVFEGDTVMATATDAGTRTIGGNRVRDLDLTLERADGEVVLTGSATIRDR